MITKTEFEIWRKVGAELAPGVLWPAVGPFEDRLKAEEAMKQCSGEVYIVSVTRTLLSEEKDLTLDTRELWNPL